MRPLELVDVDAALGWMRDSLCAEPSYRSLNWFPTDGQRVDECRSVCERCLVVCECRGYALEHRISDGVWGGTTPKERRELLRTRDARLVQSATGRRRI